MSIGSNKMIFVNYAKSLIRAILHKQNLELVSTKSNFFKKIDMYRKMILAHTAIASDSIGCIIFSMDRALQLDALLSSFFHNKNGECPVIVLYKVSNQRHQKAYDDVAKKYKNSVVFKSENNRSFKNVLLEALSELDVGKIFFLVDDIIFTEKVDFTMLSRIDTTKYIFSLRMGSHLNFSYVVNQPQKLPHFIQDDENYLYWYWYAGEFDWAYPLSVDGHIFGKQEMIAMAEYFDYKAPNSFEGILQNEKDLFQKRVGMSYKKARIVNNPCNKVQSEVENLHGTFHQDELLLFWENGKEIDITPLQGYVNKSVHEEIEFSFKERLV